MVQSLDDARRRRPSGGGGGPRVPPHNLEAEESLLGAMLLSRDAIVSAVEIQLGGPDFYKPAHGHIFEAITSLYAQGEPADPVTVAEELRRAGLLDATGGPAALVGLQANTPAIGNAGPYARIVEEHALLRRLIGVAGEIAEMGYSVPEDVSAAIDEAEALVFDVAQRRVTDSLSSLRDLLERHLDHIEALYERGQDITGVPTGFIDLDQQLAGLQPSNLIIVGGRPGTGKTSFALGIVAHAAVESRTPVLLFSLEMSHLELTQRMLCSEARVDATRMRNGRLLESDWPKIAHATGRLAEAPVYIDDNPHLTTMEIRAKARRLKSRSGLGLIVIDYLQLMSGRSNAENRQVEVSEMSRGLKILARELQVPVIALSQLSRNLETRADKRPVLADLRESGCMPAATRIALADGTERTLGELLLSQEQPLVWSLDEDWRVVASRLTKTFASGVRPVFRLRLASGYEVDATANHRFRTPDGWRALADLTPGGSVVVAPQWAPAPVGQPKAERPHRPSGDMCRPIGDLVQSQDRVRAAIPDMFWDEVVAVVPLGNQPTFDATVEGTHNFVANGVVAHNSLEQDADVVIFLYRDEVYNRDSPDRGTAEVIVAKHRNGPTGVTQLAFLDHYTRFANMARGV